MVFSLRRWANRILFIIVFAVLLFFAIGGYRWLAAWISPIHHYEKPRGDAMKAFETEMASPEGGNAADRLRWFFWYGE